MGLFYLWYSRMIFENNFFLKIIITFVYFFRAEKDIFEKIKFYNVFVYDKNAKKKKIIKKKKNKELLKNRFNNFK